MWISPYHRDQMPEGMDNSSFGEVCEQFSLINSGLDFEFLIKAESNGPYRFPASRVHGSSGAGSKDVYGACSAFTRMAVCEPAPTTIFFPDHATFIGGDGESKLMLESTWHSEIFFSNWVRCDRSTDWKFRIDRSFSAKNIDIEVANVYHRYGYQYFHWIFDALPRIWYIQRFAKNRDLKWFAGHLNQPFHQPCVDLFDLNMGSFIFPESDGVLKFTRAYNTAFSFEEDKITLRPDFNSGLYYVGWMKEYIEEIRDRAVFKTKNLSNPIVAEKIYITRQDATHRRIRNEDEVRAVVAKYGFREFCPGQHSFHDQICVFKNAKFVLGTHGAGLTNLIWTRNGAQIAEFMPDGLNDVGYRFTANLTDKLHHLLYCKSFPHEHGLAYADIEVDIDLLHALLDGMLG